MATVKLLQATNMATLPAALTVDHTYSNIDQFSHDGAFFGGFWYGATGVFDTDPDSLGLFGTISHVFIDTEDLGQFPNLEISGLSFAFTDNYWLTVPRVGKLAQFVQ